MGCPWAFPLLLCSDHSAPPPPQIAQIQKYAADGGFTNLLVFHETKKFSKGARVDGLLLVHLPAGPSAMFRVSNVKLTKDISGHGRASTHTPELILNNFTTALGHRVGRMLGSLLPQDPEFKGRRVITLHNQRDYIFFRHHRYVFEQRAGERKAEHTGHLAPPVAPPPPGTSRKKQKKKKKAAAGAGAAAQEDGEGEGGGEGDGHVIARLQELGPRFTLKLQARCMRACMPDLRAVCGSLTAPLLSHPHQQSLQKGVFDPTRGEFEWVRPAPGDAAGASRRKFFL